MALALSVHPQTMPDSLRNLLNTAGFWKCQETDSSPHPEYTGLILGQENCYGLNVECTPQAHVLRTWSPAGVTVLGDDGTLGTQGLPGQSTTRNEPEEALSASGSSGSLLPGPGSMQRAPLYIPTLPYLSCHDGLHPLKNYEPKQSSLPLNHFCWVFCQGDKTPKQTHKSQPSAMPKIPYYRGLWTSVVAPISSTHLHTLEGSRFA